MENAQPVETAVSAAVTIGDCSETKGAGGSIGKEVGELRDELGSGPHWAKAGSQSVGMGLEVRVRTEQDDPRSDAATQPIGPVRQTRRPVDEDKVEVIRKVSRRVDAH